MGKNQASKDRESPQVEFDEERQEYAAAETALDLATMLYRIRQEEGPGEQHVAARSSLKQQAISHLGIVASTMQLGTLQRCLSALGYCNEAEN